jgi:radical SAM superfamily enzyme YgiQ (UPF0313 family)
MSIDIVLINVPGTNGKMPLLAPAMLKASIIKNGFSCKTIDFNIRFKNEYFQHQDYANLDTFFLTEYLDPKLKPTVDCMIDTWADEILEYDPQYIGISVFTYQSRAAAEIFSRVLKQKRPNIKIILGGQGISQGGINGVSSFPLKLQQEGIIDYFIKSEGELSLIELLKNNFSYPGINSNTFQQIKNLDELPYPDYDDYDFSQYEIKYLTIIASRGCVRKCTFCDIHEHWKYNFRRGSLVVDEMISQSQKYKINEFVFADSLVNGSLKEFKIFLKKLADYNNKVDKKLTWRGQYIVRDSISEGEDHWNLMAQSGCKELWVGIEHGSERIRTHMGKKFKNSDIDYLVQQLEKHDIKAKFLMIVGYPMETQDDFQETLNLIERYKNLAGTIIKSFEISDTLSILPGTPLFNNANHWNIVIDDKFENNWICIDNPDLTLDERINRVKIASQLTIDLGYNEKTDAHDLLGWLTDNIDKLNNRLKAKRMIKLKKIE